MRLLHAVRWLDGGGEPAPRQRAKLGGPVAGLLLEEAAEVSVVVEAEFGRDLLHAQRRKGQLVLRFMNDTRIDRLQRRHAQRAVAQARLLPGRYAQGVRITWPGGALFSAILTR